METEAAEIRRSIEQVTADLFDIEERKIRYRAEQLQAKLKAVEAKASMVQVPVPDQFNDAVSTRTSHRFSSAPAPNTTLNNDSVIGSAGLTITTTSDIPQPSSSRLIVTLPASSDPNTNEATEDLLKRGPIQLPALNIPTTKTSSTHLPLSSMIHLDRLGDLDRNTIPAARLSSTYQHAVTLNHARTSKERYSQSPRQDSINRQTRHEREGSQSEMDSPGAARHRRPSIRSEDVHWNTDGMGLSLRGDGSEDDNHDFISRGRRDDSLRAGHKEQDERRRSTEQERYGARSALKTRAGSHNIRYDERDDEDDDEDDYGHEGGRLREAGMKRKNREDTGTGTSEAGGGKRQNVGAGKKKTKLELAKEIADDDDAYQLKGVKRCQTCRETKRRDRDDVCIVLMDIYGKKCSSCVKHGNKCEFSTSKHSAPSNKDPPASPSRGRASAPATRSRVQKKKRDTRIPLSTILDELDGLTSKANKIVSRTKEIKRWIMEYGPHDHDNDDDDDDDDDDEDDRC